MSQRAGGSREQRDTLAESRFAAVLPLPRVPDVGPPLTTPVAPA
jgi:hypothetical protein